MSTGLGPLDSVYPTINVCAVASVVRTEALRIRLKGPTGAGSTVSVAAALSAMPPAL
jgi:hypothetical protein